MSVEEKVAALLARAVDAGAPEEEQRTAAVIAARLIREHALALTSAVVEDAPRLHDRRVMRSKYSGRCRCGARYSVGNLIAWRRGDGAICLGCNDAERRAA